MKNIDGITLATFVRRVKKERDEQFSLLVGWRPAWDDIAEEEWSFGMTPGQALERIEQSEGLA